MQEKLSNLLKGFRKNHYTQYCLMYKLEIWKNMLDKWGYVCAMFLDLSKAFDTIHHELMIAKLGALVFHRMLFSTRETTYQINNKEFE